MADVVLKLTGTDNLALEQALLSRFQASGFLKSGKSELVSTSHYSGPELTVEEAVSLAHSLILISSCYDASIVHLLISDSSFKTMVFISL